MASHWPGTYGRLGKDGIHRPTAEGAWATAHNGFVNPKDGGPVTAIAWQGSYRGSQDGTHAGGLAFQRSPAPVKNAGQRHGEQTRHPMPYPNDERVTDAYGTTFTPGGQERVSFNTTTHNRNGIHCGHSNPAIQLGRFSAGKDSRLLPFQTRPKLYGEGAIATVFTPGKPTGALNARKMKVSQNLPIRDSEPVVYHFRDYLDACSRGDVGMAEELLALDGMLLHQANDNGMTGLMAAAANNHADMCRYLVEEGASVQVRDDDGETAIFYCCSSGAADAAEALWGLGAHVYARDVMGRSALEIAQERGHQTIVDMINRTEPMSQTGYTFKA